MDTLLSFADHEMPPHGENTSFDESRQVTTVSNPLESLVASQQEQINGQSLKVEATQRKIYTLKFGRTKNAVGTQPIGTSTERASSVSPSSYRNMIFNLSAWVIS